MHLQADPVQSVLGPLLLLGEVAPFAICEDDYAARVAQQRVAQQRTAMRCFSYARIQYHVAELWRRRFFNCRFEYSWGVVRQQSKLHTCVSVTGAPTNTSINTSISAGASTGGASVPADLFLSSAPAMVCKVHILRACSACFFQ